jgi:hypothetical protein
MIGHTSNSSRNRHRFRNERLYKTATIVISLLIAIAIACMPSMLSMRTIEHRRTSKEWALFHSCAGQEYGRIPARRPKLELETTMAKGPAEETRTKRSETQITTAFDPTQALNGIEPIFQAGNKWLENWMAVSSELLEFGRARLDRNLEVGKAIARSGSFDEAMELQADYARSTVREYFTEAGKIADLGTRALLDGIMVWQPAIRETTRRGASAQAA